MMAHGGGDFTNFLCLLILYVAIYGGSFLFAGFLSGFLALIDISARYLHPKKETWISADAFDAVLNIIFVLLVAPGVLVTLRAAVEGHGIAVWIMALDFIAGIYHGIFVGRTIAEYRRLPHFWDLIDEVVPM